jgi:hypothetical protein
LNIDVRNHYADELDGGLFSLEKASPHSFSFHASGCRKRHQASLKTICPFSCFTALRIPDRGSQKRLIVAEV